MWVRLVAMNWLWPLLSAFAVVSAHGATTFGPQQFTRTSGAPQTVTATFPRCAGGTCQLVVINGNSDGTQRVSSASIYLNGREVFGPSDFNPKVARLAKPVALQATDEIKVVLKSSPGSFVTVSVECDSFPALVIDTPPGVVTSLWSDGKVSLSIPLANEGNTTASNVSITGMSAGGGSYVGPASFAYSAGSIAPDQVQQLNAIFSSLDGTKPFPLTITGTYGFVGAVCPFQVQATVNPPPPGNGGTPKSTATVPSFTADTASFAHPPITPPNREPNAESEWMPPLGEPRRLFAVEPGASALDRVKAFSPRESPPDASSPSEVLFFRNANGGSYGGLPPDPSAAGAASNGFAMISANTAVSYSKDYGKTFTTVNLTKANGFSDPLRPTRTDFFPEVDGGLCCDQVLQYVPSQNLIVWLLQYWSPNINVGGLAQKGQNRLRIAWATPEAAAANFLGAWRWFDISPATLGDSVATDWMDYPDLSFSKDWLYISVDHGLWNAGKDSSGNVIGQRVYTNRRWFVRASLANMASNAGSINLVYYEANKNGLVKAHFAHSAPDAMYFAALPDTSTLSVFVDPDASPDIPTPKDVKISSYCPTSATSSCDYSVNAPDGLNWNVAPHGVLGATYVAPSAPLCPPNQSCDPAPKYVYFAFDGSRDNGIGRAYPYVRVEKIKVNGSASLVSELDIWNSAYAFATPGLNSHPGLSVDEVAISLAVGGGVRYADNAVGFLGDFVVYATTGSNATESDGSSNVRYGDYFNVRNATTPGIGSGQGWGYSTAAYSVTRADPTKTCAAGGCNVDLKYILFGHNGDLFPANIIVR